MFENIFETINSGFAQALYEDYLRDPNSVPAAWRELFENGLKGVTPLETPGKTSEPPPQEKRPRVVPGFLEPIKGSALRLLQNMEASLAVPTATSYREVDVTRLWNARAELNRRLEAKGIKLSFTHLVGWAIVKAARRFPVMTHAVVEENGQYWRWDPQAVNLGIAVDLEGKDGRRRLMVPVLRQAQELDFARFYREYERLVGGAREGTLAPDAYLGGTITLTNPGTIGTSASVPRLMKGQGSIIATGAIREVAGIRLMTISSTYDHRIIQGAESGMFLRELDRLLQGEDGFYQEVASSLGIEVRFLAPRVGAAVPAVEPTLEAPVSEEMLFHVAAAMSVVKHHRTHGYLAARLDPLGTEPVGDPALDPANVGLTPEVMAKIPAAVLRVYVEGETMAEVLPRLREVYCGTIAYEIEHIASHEQRVWLREVVESGRHRTPLDGDEKRALLEVLTRVEGLEQFLHKSYLGQKRFGIEGLDMLVPMLRKAIDLAAEQGAKAVDLGMAHRGRLNVLAHVVGVPYRTIIEEFEGGVDVDTLLTSGRTGDVKYHHGASGEYTTSSGKVVAVSLMPNPSHLEAVDPVLEGVARAEQTDRSGPEAKHDPNSVLPVLIHGDAAFAAQGVVAETFNLARLPGYSTGGTLHIIANNQIGFTTTPSEARSTDFASDLAKGFDVPIIHVNADDPEACIAAVRLAIMYRQKFAGDVVINLVGYRRHGHNEADEPRYTQPSMYRIIDQLPTVRARYARSLIEEGVLTEDEVEAVRERVERELNEIRDAVKRQPPVEASPPQVAVRRSGRFAAEHEPDTRVDAALLRELNEELLRVPDGFKVNPKLRRQLEKRREVVANGGRLDWAHAEALAFASLLVEGIPLRLSGQDSVRGTFSQRHLTLFDSETGEPYTPIQHLSKARAPFELYNSPLSEYAVLGFEYGYSVEAQEALVMWEAQFGDFANGAEVIIDQFVIAGLPKWGQTSRLTMLLPHGYEGQGPEHSSARLERYLALGAENNIRVANCSTPAQYFHLLRRQAKHQELRPLVLMTPKSLLRLPEASSTLEELASGRFEYVLDDPTLPAGREAVRKLVLCSGKIYYDAATSPLRKAAGHVALGRVELLYPFPYDAVRKLIESYPNLERIVWLQEEPRNMGARKFVVPKIAEITDLPIDHVSRPERASPAEGYPAAHQREQERLIAEALR